MICPECGLDMWLVSKLKDQLAEMTEYAYELGKQKHALTQEQDEARESAWLKQMLEIEDGGCISVGGLVTRLKQAAASSPEAAPPPPEPPA